MSRFSISFFRLFLATSIVGLAFSPSSTCNGQNVNNCLFTRTKIEFETVDSTLIRKIQDEIETVAQKTGGILFAVWTPPVKLPNNLHPILRNKETTSNWFALKRTQLAVMFAWPQGKTKVKTLESNFKKFGTVLKMTTRTFKPIFVNGGITVPTGEGFYVHSENRYQSRNVEKAVELERGHFKTFDRYYKSRTIGCFQELDSDKDQEDTLLVIKWYPDTLHWIKAQETWMEPDSHEKKTKTDAIGIQTFA